VLQVANQRREKLSEIFKIKKQAVRRRIIIARHLVVDVRISIRFISSKIAYTSERAKQKIKIIVVPTVVKRYRKKSISIA
jgi:hypothetical protein